MYQNVQTSILDVNTVVPELVLKYQLTLCNVFNPHATRSTSNMHRNNKDHAYTWKYTTIYTWCQGRNQLIFSGVGKMMKLLAAPYKYIRLWKFRGGQLLDSPPMVAGLRGVYTHSGSPAL